MQRGIRQHDAHVIVAGGDEIGKGAVGFFAEQEDGAFFAGEQGFFGGGEMGKLVNGRYI